MSEEREYNDIIAVDENDVEVGTMNMMVAIEKGLLRRAARVYVFNQSGQLLVQRRSEHVLKPLLLDQSCAGHVDAGETYTEAAYRELEEELGLTGYELEEVMTSVRTKDFFSAFYRVIIPDDTKINYDPHELDGVVWYTLVDLDADMLAHPEQFNPDFHEAWKNFRATLIP
jgi:isopentenyldiphosphate isomerase